MANYFNTLNLRQQLAQLGKCRFMGRDEFADGASYLQGKKVVIVGCGAQGLNQGLNMRDSGLDISYALRKEAIAEKRASWRKATENGFKVGTYEELIPQADLVVNLTPDKQHSDVVRSVQPLMKDGAALGYSHGFNIVEVGEQIRKDITVVMVAPKCPGTEVREEYKRGFGVPTLIAVHPENDPKGEGMAIAKAWAAATGGHRAGVLESSFVAEVKSDLMGKLPGMGQIPDNVKSQMDDKVLVRMEAIINSMTMKERAKPEIIKGSRKRRIAAGCGMQVQDVNRLLKQFDDMQRMMKKMKKGGMAKMMRSMKGMMPPGFPGTRSQCS